MGLKGTIAFAIAKGLEDKQDGRELGKKLDEAIDKSLGGKASEKIQKGPISNFLFEIVEGLWEEDVSKLSERVQVWLDDLKDRSNAEVAKKDIG